MVNPLIYRQEMLKISMLMPMGQMVSPGAKAAIKMTSSFNRAAAPKLAKVPKPKSISMGTMKPMSTPKLFKQQNMNPVSMTTKTLSKSMGRGVTSGG